MDAKFFDGLYEGDSPNGVKLGMGLTGGDFWSRVEGCRNLYRGEGPFDLDFERLVAVGDIDASQIVSDAAHEAGSVYYYVLRDVNGCGDEVHSSVMVRAASRFTVVPQFVRSAHDPARKPQQHRARG